MTSKAIPEKNDWDVFRKTRQEMIKWEATAALRLRQEKDEQNQATQEWSAKARKMSTEAIEVCRGQAGMALWAISKTAELSQGQGKPF